MYREKPTTNPNWPLSHLPSPGPILMFNSDIHVLSNCKLLSGTLQMSVSDTIQVHTSSYV